MKSVVSRITAVFLLLVVLPAAQAALPNVTADGNALPSLAPMLKQVNPACGDG